MKAKFICTFVAAAGVLLGALLVQGGVERTTLRPLRLPPVPIPEDAFQSAARIALGDMEIDDLAAFMETLTSPGLAHLAKQTATECIERSHISPMS